MSTSQHFSPMQFSTPVAPITLACLIEGESLPFIVKLKEDISIMELKDLIHEKGINATEHAVLAKDLILWKVDLVNPSEDKWNTLTHNDVKSERLKELDNISEYSFVPIPKALHIIVELLHDRATSPQLSETISAETIAILPLIDIVVDDRGNFGRSSTVGNNRISELLLGTEPEFLVEFRTKLDQRRWVESDTSLAVLSLKDELDNFGKYFQESATDGGQSGRFSNSGQLRHLANALLLEGWKKDEVINEDNIRWIFDELGWHFHSVLGSREKHAFRGDWPFSLTVTVKSEGDTYRYTPRSDFHVSVDGLVRVMVEVQSDRDEKDRYQMLLQGASAARFGRNLSGRPFIVMALYIKKNGSVMRYLLFEDGDDAKVSYVSDVQDWKSQPSHLFKAIFEMYNLLSVLSDTPVSDTARISLFQSDLKKFYKKTYTSKMTRPDTGEGGTGPNKRSHKGQGGNTGNALRHGEHVYYGRQVVDAFTRAGYKLESYDDDEIFLEPMNELTPTMRYAKQSDGTRVVVKKLRPDSDELSILQYLHSFASSHNHILPLLRALELDVGTFIFLPVATPLELGFIFKRFCNNGADFSHQLINGVAFLHRCYIAHLDIKPGNIVVFENRLLIIDFDISVRVDGPDALIDLWCGTPGWMAPEIGHEDGPVCRYSPIRADLWSCGRMLEYLASKGVVQDKWIKTLTKRLLNKNPLLRPPLDVQSSVTAAYPLSDWNGRLKRKLDALPHDTKRLAIFTGL